MKGKLEKIVRLLPFAWVLVCYDTEPNLHFGSIFEMVGTFAACIVFSFVLDALGSVAVSVDRDDAPSAMQLLCRFAVLAAFLYFVTNLISR